MTKTKIVKFFITPIYPYGNDHYYHEMIALAEGFYELGYEVIGNCNYWWQPETNSFLIKEELENNNFEIAIYDYRYVTSFDHLLFRSGFPNFDKTKKHVLVDRNDWLKPIWWNNPNYKIFDFIFAGNLYDTVNYPNNVKPWAIGLTNRIIKSIDSFYKIDSVRSPVTGYNFRVDHNMRGYVLANLKDKLITYPAEQKLTEPNFDTDSDALYYKTSVKRHNPIYYQQLCNTKLFMAFGGYYEFKPIRYLPYSILDKIVRKPAYWKYNQLKKSSKDFSDQIFIFQQDNFRFWEVLYSGSIAINLDLSAWHFKLPVMPISGKHYIGIKKLKDNDIEYQLSKMNSEELTLISQVGRAWVHENYSPKAQAQRILDYVRC